MKRIFLVFAVLCVLCVVCGCTNVSLPGNNIADTAVSQSDSDLLGVGGVVLGMSAEEVLAILSERKEAVVMPDYADIMYGSDELSYQPHDGRIYNETDFSFYYTTEADMTYRFSYEGELLGISGGGDATTDEGLTAGDSVEKMKGIYGTGYAENPEDMPVYRYAVKNGYIFFYHDNGIITGWRISIYPEVIND